MLIPFLATLNAAHQAGTPAVLPTEMVAGLVQHYSGVEQSEYISEKEVCAALHITRQTLWRWRRTGVFIEPVKLPFRGVRYERAAFNRWLAARSS